jgi:hypothetical protein
MTAATGKSANGGHVARAQHANPLRTADRSRAPGRLRASDRSESARRPEGTSHPPVAERITVALIPKVADILLILQERTNLSKTDLVNRALTLLDFFEAQMDAGRDILIRDNVTQEIQSVRLL